MKKLLDKLIEITLFSIPLEGILILNNEISFARVLGGIIVLLWLVNVLIGHRDKLELSFTIKMKFVFILLIFFSAIIHSEVNIFENRIFTIIRNFFFIFVLYNSITSLKQIISNLKSYCFGVILLCGVGLYEFMIHGQVMGLLIGTGQNTFALHLVLAFPILVYLRNNTTIVIRNLYNIIIVLSIIGIIISESRSAYFAIVIYVIYYSFLAFSHTNKNLILKIISIVFLPIAIFYIINKFEMLSLVEKNLNSFNLSNITSMQYDGRIVHWMAGINIFLDSPIVGVGFGRFQKLFFQEYQFDFDTRFKWDGSQKTYGSNRSTHSTIIGFMAEFGIIGIFYWCYFLIISYKNLFNNWSVYLNNRNIYIMYKALFIVLCFFIFIMRLETIKFFWIIFTFIDKTTFLQLRQYNG